MKYVIPSRSRFHLLPVKGSVFSMLPPKDTILFVHPSEYEEYKKFKDYEVVTKPYKTIPGARQVIHELMMDEDVYFQIDDDCFLKHNPGNKRLTESELFDFIKRLSKVNMEAPSATVPFEGVSSQAYQWALYTSMLGIECVCSFYMPFFKEHKVSWLVKEDDDGYCIVDEGRTFALNLSAIGYPCLVDGTVVKDRNKYTEGGCNIMRDPSAIDLCRKRMKEAFPDYITLTESKEERSYGEKIKITTHFMKALKDGYFKRTGKPFKPWAVK